MSTFVRKNGFRLPIFAQIARLHHNLGNPPRLQKKYQQNSDFLVLKEAGQ